MASTKQLKSGVIRDCGCVPKTNARNGRVAEDLTGKVYGYLTVLNRIDLTGQRFGRLTALRPTERRDRKGVSILDVQVRLRRTGRSSRGQAGAGKCT